MTRLTIKLSALLLLSAGYLMASSANTKPNLIKNSTKTNISCECFCPDQGEFLIVTCQTGGCSLCCDSAGCEF